MAQAPLTLRRWRRAEYDRLVELGVFAGEAIELLGGQVVVAEPQSSRHAAAISVAAQMLQALAGPDWAVRVQLPVALDDESQPEPDVALVPGAHTDYWDAHPAHPALVVEVADSMLAVDRGHKGSLYARAGLADYWIVNLVDGVLEIYRDPEPDPAAPFGWRYRSVTVLAPPAAATPLALPAARLPVAALLPGA